MVAKSFRVGLGGKADQVGNVPEGFTKNAKVTGERGVAVQIKGGPDLPRKGCDGDLLTVEVFTPIVKMVHW
jgi:hypothetical protein